MTAPKVIWLDESSEKIDPQFFEAKQAIRKYVEDAGECTVGQLKREFPAFVHVIWDCLHDLKLDGHVNFSESSPPPTRITAKSMRRVTPLVYKSSSTHRASNMHIPCDILNSK